MDCVVVLGSTVLGVPPPGSGAVLISILNIMDGYNDITNDATTYHRLVEVCVLIVCLVLVFGKGEVVGRDGCQVWLVVR